MCYLRLGGAQKAAERDHVCRLHEIKRRAVGRTKFGKRRYCRTQSLVSCCRCHRDAGAVGRTKFGKRRPPRLSNSLTVPTVLSKKQICEEATIVAGLQLRMQNLMQKLFMFGNGSCLWPDRASRGLPVRSACSAATLAPTLHAYLCWCSWQPMTLRHVIRLGRRSQPRAAWKRGAGARFDQ